MDDGGERMMKEHPILKKDLKNIFWMTVVILVGCIPSWLPHL